MDWGWANGLARWVSDSFDFVDTAFDYNPGNGPGHDELKRSEDNSNSNLNWRH